ncbi:MAG: sulfatase-like hydrolase/transferase [Bryobacterales bacterium]|nr:sulfatase-like hydrolase/transferase [Bryobacterales bacterium]MBV9398934.1 sulfatase-like hydrolase/transferase [Bryobacterales bacterium]
MPKASKTKPNNYVVVVFDSCRYDSFTAAKPKTIKKLGKVEKRWSYASWTSPSHYNLLIGLMPHTSPRHVYASEYYKNDFLKFNTRLGVDNIEFKSLVPKLFLPMFLRDGMGYQTNAMVSLPVLNPKTILNNGFDTYRLMDKHNDMRAMVRSMAFSEEKPNFFLLNVGETHYPYALPDEPPDQWPRISGVHGVFKHLDDEVVGGKLLVKKDAKKDRFFNNKKLEELRQRQIAAVKHLDGVVEELFDIVPKNTFITILADHGELFGEDGYFGHGPIYHEKVWEVPFVEGKLR